ncbi:MAG: hypothetical protein ACKOU6_11370 [Planctomycetota bacterium]
MFAFQLRSSIFARPLGLACLLLLSGSLGSDLGGRNDLRAESPGPTANGSFVIGPDYKLDVDLTDRGQPKGKSFEFSMKLAESKIFPGTDSTLDPAKPVRKERKIFVYIPAAYQDGVKAPLLVTLDGPSHLNLIRHALDNLTVSQDPMRKLPAFIVISVENWR